jgi:hypothetical protein
MPRPKPTIASPVFHATPHRLKDAATKTLVAPLRYQAIAADDASADGRQPTPTLLVENAGETTALNLCCRVASEQESEIAKKIWTAIDQVETALGFCIHGAPHIRGTLTGRRTKGAFVYAATEEKRELEFVGTALGRRRTAFPVRYGRHCASWPDCFAARSPSHPNRPRTARPVSAVRGSSLAGQPRPSTQ